ncbi:metal-dependent hydrolase [Orrella sp. JC864]|uniref:metal-dependent hydrolase n=1 Tax=Orrella sp. JC864 TaxID=3120298 RepID=UPI00300BA08E
MDSLTQAVLGAGLQGAVLGRFQGRKALAYGALLATLPDMDVVMSYADPVSSMTYHRGFSHSVFVLSGLAATMTWLIRKRWPDAGYSSARLFMALWLVLVTHPILDAFTSYGTQLFWPLAVTPASWSSLFIIDPGFTVPLLLAVVLAAIGGPRSRLWQTLWWALAWCVLYLCLSLAGKGLAEHRVRQALRERGVPVQQVFSAPMPFNILLWRVVAREGDGYYEAVSGWFDRAPPEMVRQPLHPELAVPLLDSPQYVRLDWFSGGWLRRDAIGDELVVSDLRMGMTGYYTFRFVMARRVDGQWQPVLPERWPSSRGGEQELRAVGRRILAQEPPLPLPQWSLRNAAPRTAPTRPGLAD